MTTGVMASKVVTALTVKKQLRLIAATSKNYEAGQIHSVRGAVHRFEHFAYEISGFLKTPILIVYCTYRLLKIIGPIFFIGLSMLVIWFYLDRRLRLSLGDSHNEHNKLNDKRMNIISESFDNIKVIKFYGWD